jgi:phenylpyruvate tautomerase PptA (4-oxalocrotonate tautomerase family)
MPHLTFKNFESTKELSSSIVTPLASAIGATEDKFTFSTAGVKTYMHSKDISEEIIFVDVIWVARSQDIKDNVAKIITDAVEKLCTTPKKVVVLFYNMEKTDIYEHGKHL